MTRADLLVIRIAAHKERKIVFRSRETGQTSSGMELIEIAELEMVNFEQFREAPSKIILPLVDRFPSSGPRIFTPLIEPTGPEFAYGVCYGKSSD